MTSTDEPGALLREIVAALAGAGVQHMVVGAEDTVVAKLEWAKAGASDRQLEDIAGIIRVRGTQLDRDYITRWVTELALEDQWQRALALT